MDNVNLNNSLDQSQKDQSSSLITHALTKNSHHWVLVVVIIIAVVILFGVWFYISQLQGQNEFNQQPATVNSDSRENMIINNELESVDLGDLDNEFKAVDQDLESL